MLSKTPAHCVVTDMCHQNMLPAFLEPEKGRRTTWEIPPPSLPAPCLCIRGSQSVGLQLTYSLCFFPHNDTVLNNMQGLDKILSTSLLANYI